MGLAVAFIAPGASVAIGGLTAGGGAMKPLPEGGHVGNSVRGVVIGGAMGGAIGAVIFIATMARGGTSSSTSAHPSMGSCQARWPWSRTAER